MTRFYEPRVARIVAQRTPQLADTRSQGVIADGLSLPQPIDQPFLGYDPHRPFGQGGQQGRGTRCELDLLIASPQLAGAAVELILPESHTARRHHFSGSSAVFRHYLPSWHAIFSHRSCAASTRARSTEVDMTALVCRTFRSLSVDSFPLFRAQRGLTC